MACSQVFDGSVIKATEARSIVTWKPQGKNKWISSTGISLALYSSTEAKKNTSSARFWDAEPLLSAQFGKGQHTAEAEAILKKMDPGGEIETSAFFRRSGDYRWPLYEPTTSCPPEADCESWPYVIRYLHRPLQDWTIDRLMSYGKGTLSHKILNGQDVYAISDGPYQSIFEGRFKQGKTVLWFIAQDQNKNKNIWNKQMRFDALQSINIFLKTIKER